MRESLCLLKSCFKTGHASWEGMFLSEHVLWMAYLEEGYALLEDMSYRNTGFTGGIGIYSGHALKEGMFYRSIYWRAYCTIVCIV